MSEDNKIRLSLEELTSEDISKRVREMDDAKKVALVRNVGAPTSNPDSSAGLKAIMLLTGAGTAGGILAFIIIKVVLYGLLNGESKSSTFVNLGFTFCLALLIGLTLSMVEAASTRIGSKVVQAAIIAVPSAIGLGLLIGSIANSYYSNAMQNLYSQALARVSSGESEETVLNWLTSQNHFPRGVAWLLVGVASGITVGAASKSSKRLALTTGGGAIGGFLGGFFFDFFPQNLEWVAQVAGISFTGLLIGLSMALLEQAARTQWIEIVEGGMAGKQFILYKRDLTIGSSPTADITLIKDSAIAPLHARIYSQGGRTVLESLNPGMPCSVDGVSDNKFNLADSSNITLGGTTIRFREKKNQKQTTGGIIN